MALEDVAVDGLILKFTDSGISGTLTPTSIPSSTTKIGGKFVYRGQLDFNAAGVTDGSCTSLSTPGVIPPTATRTRVDGMPIMREGDIVTGVMTVNGVSSSGSSPCSFTFGVEIADGGQPTVRAE